MDFKSTYLRNLYWLKDWLKGSPVGQHYHELKKFGKASHEVCERIRQKKLENLLRYASANSSFYKRFAGKDLSQFPVMNKTSLLEHYDEIAVKPENIPGQVGKVHIQSTSGSTGTPFRIPQDTGKRNRRIAELKYFGEIVGFKSHETLIHLRTWNRWQSKTPKQIKQENIIPFDISTISDESLHELCENINKYKAICLRGYASSFDLVAKYAQDHAYSFPSLKVVIAGSESLHDDTRALVKKVLGCEIIDQYANEECGPMAQNGVPTKESDNVMYLNHAGYIFEFLKLNSDEPAEPGELSRLVVTDFHNYAFPVIRYDTGDTVKWQPYDEKSNGFPIIEKLYGRRFDLCFTTSGKFVYPLTIGRILKHYDKIVQWQFIQKEEKKYILKVNIKNSAEKNYLDSALTELIKSLGDDADITIEYTDNIPVLASGKRKPVINEWKK